MDGDMDDKISIPDIVIIASTDNDHATKVHEYLCQEHPKITASIIDSSMFPQQMAIELRCDNDNLYLQFHNHDSELSISMENVRSIWWWEPGIPQICSSIQDKSHLQFAYVECCQAFEGLWYIQDCLWVNQPERQEVALNHLYQIQLAKMCGFDIPQTLVSNYPKAAQEFWQKNDGQVIYRQLVPFSPGYEVLEESFLQEIDDLRLAPVMFQKLEPFVEYINVIVIGQKVTAVQMVQDSENASYQKCEIPREIEIKVQFLTKYAGLLYSLLQLGMTEDKRYVFLALDPCASFLEMEKQAGLHLVEIMARLLVGGQSKHTESIWPVLPSLIKKTSSYTRPSSSS